MSPHNKREPYNLADLDPESFGAQLRRLRENAGLSQKELGEAIGLDQARISAYERNKYVPQEDVLERLAEVLDVTTGELFESSRWGGALPIGNSRRELLRKLKASDWRVLDHVIDVIGDATPEERAAFETGLQRFLESWK